MNCVKIQLCLLIITEFATRRQVAKHGRKQKSDVPVRHWPLCCHGDGDIHRCRSLHRSLFWVITDNTTNPMHSLPLNKVLHFWKLNKRSGRCEISYWNNETMQFTKPGEPLGSAPQSDEVNCRMKIHPTVSVGISIILSYMYLSANHTSCEKNFPDPTQS